MQSHLRTATEDLLQKLDAFFTAADDLPSGCYHWEDDEAKVNVYQAAFIDLRQQYIATIQVKPD